MGDAGQPSGASQALRQAAATLAPVSPTPRLDAELLLAHALGVSREALLLAPAWPVPPAFAALIARRLRHEPVAYLTGSKSFWTIELRMTRDVLIPRPDSETLIEAAVAHFRARAPARILDLGTGSGALLLAALDQWPRAWGLGTDRSPAALAVARDNAARLGLSGRAAFAQADWAQPLMGRFDLILCNPPYVETGATLPPGVVEHEPASALFAGADGLAAYARLVPQLPPLLAAGGMAALEIGLGQAGAVQALAAEAGMETNVHRDLAGIDRCVALILD